MKKKKDRKTYYPVAKPILEGNELRYITDAVKSGWVSSAGAYVQKFEESFARFCDVKYALTCSNGTAALHLALLALGIGPRDEVIVPTFTFIATANVISYVGATPVFVDIEPRYWQIDPEKIKKAITDKTKAIIPVHLHGHPCKMDEIMAIARKHNLFVIEDVAEALGAEVRGKKAGSWGDLGCFSFFGNKIITTGEGGMITTNNKKLAEKISVLRNHGMAKKGVYYHEVLGYNYRLTNIQAALGLAQLEKLDVILKKKTKIASWYKNYLRSTSGLTFQPQASWARAVCWMVSLVIDPKIIKNSRDHLIAELKSLGIETRPFFIPLHHQPVFSEYRNYHLPCAEDLSEHGLSLPSYASLSKKDTAFIAGKIKSIINNS